MTGPVVTNNSPSSGYISWSAFSIQYLGQTYSIAAGNTNLAYTWWPYNSGSGGALQSSNTQPSLTPDDLLLFLNKSGVGIIVPQTDVLDGSLIVPGTIMTNAIAANAITSSLIAADAVTATQIAAGAVTADEVQAGAITADKLSIGSVGDDAVLNGSFEDFANGLPLGWTRSSVSTSGSTTDVVSGVGQSGTNSARLIATTTQTAAIEQNTSSAISTWAGDLWYIGAFAGATAAITSGFKVTAVWLDANKAVLTTGGTTDVPLKDTNGNATNGAVGTSFGQQSGQVTAPTGAHYLMLRVQLVNPNANTTVYVDVVSANKVTVSARIADGAITTPKLQAGAVTASTIASGTITTNQIASGTILAGNIAAGTLTSASGVFGTIDAGSITAGTLAAARIGAGTITGSMIAGTTVTASNIAANTITASQIAANTITAAQIAANTITATQIASGTITATSGTIASIDASKISTGILNAASATISSNANNTGARIELTANGLKAYNTSGTNTVAINSDGSANFSGNITGSSITGSTINMTSETALTPPNPTLNGSASLGTATWSGGAAGTIYYYKLTVTNNGGESLPSAEASVACTAGNGILVHWTSMPVGATGVKIYRGTAAGAENALVATVPANKFSWLDTGLAGTAKTPPTTDGTANTTESVHADSSGLWVGGTNFTNSMFSVDMGGNIHAKGLATIPNWQTDDAPYMRMAAYQDTANNKVSLRMYNGLDYDASWSRMTFFDDNGNQRSYLELAPNDYGSPSAANQYPPTLHIESNLNGIPGGSTADKTQVSIDTDNGQLGPITWSADPTYLTRAVHFKDGIAVQTGNILTPYAGWVAYPNLKCDAYLLGDKTTVRVNAVLRRATTTFTTAVGTYYQFGQINASYAPSASVYFPVFTSGTTALCYGYLDSSGVMWFYTTAAVTVTNGSTWFGANFVYNI